MAEGSSFEDAYAKECCVICKQGFEMGNSTNVSEKGLSATAKTRKTSNKFLVCRRDFTDAKRVICSNDTA